MGSIRKNDKIILTYYVNPHHFYFKYKVDAPGDEQLATVNKKIEVYVSRHIEKRRSNPYSPEIGEIVLCHYISDCVYNWIRARVDFKLQYNKEMFVLWAIDYGFPIECEPRLIRPILSDELKVPVNGLIFKGGLFEIVPSTMEYNFMKSVAEPRKTKKWSLRAVEKVEKYLHQADNLTFKCRAYFEDHYFGSLIISSQLIVHEFLKSSNEAVDSDNFLKEFSLLEDQPYWQRQSQDAIYKIYENNSDLPASNDVITTWTPTDDQLNKIEMQTDLPKLLEVNNPETATTDEALIKLSHQFDAATKLPQSGKSSLFRSRTSTSATNETVKPKFTDTKDVTFSEIPMKSRLAVAQQKIMEQGKITARKNAQIADKNKKMMDMTFPAGFIVDNKALEDKHKHSDDVVTMSANLTKKKNISRFDRAKAIEECFSVGQADLLLVHSHGNVEYTRVNDIHDIDFPQQIHDALKALNIQQVFRIQTVGWPALLSGSSMILVNNARSGKTWTYLPAICGLIIQRTQDNKVVEGCGPLAIITCASTQEVNETTDRIAHLLRFTPGIRCFRASRFSDQGIVMCHLLSGTEVLVTTVPCLSRLMVNELRLFTKGRIISLIFDNIDLAYERFGRQILKIHKALCDPTSNVQMIVTSRTWHKVLANFYEESARVTLCIGSYIEAAVYGLTKMTIELLGKNHKIDKLIAHINDINYRFELTIVICNTSADVLELVQKLQTMSIEIWCYHDKSDSFEIGAIKNQIRNCKFGDLKLLICTDEVLHDIDIRCANHIVHFSLPPTWTMFGFRFSTLFDQHRNLTERKSDQKGTSSVVFLDEYNNDELPRLIDFMQMRANCNIPERLLKSAELIRIENVSNVYQPFCNDLAAIGICYGQFTCRQRHIFTKFDRPNGIPTNGFVKFDIVAVRSPVHFTVRLLEHRLSSEVTWTQLHSTDEFFLFNMEMMKHFEDEENQTLHFPIALGDLCAVSVQSMGGKLYERGKIVKIEEKKYMTMLTTTYTVEILLIDQNELMSCSSSALIALPIKFKNFPCQAVDVRIVNIVPRDFDDEWHPSILDLVKKWIVNQNQHYYQGLVKLSAMNTIWVESVDVIEVLPSINKKVQSVSIKKNLLDRNLCVWDTKHLEVLTTLAKNADLLRAQNVDTKATKIVDRRAKVEVSVFNKSDEEDFDIDESNPSLLNWSTSSGDDDTAVPFRENPSHSVESSDAHEEDFLRLSQDKWAEITTDQFDKVFLCNFYHPNRIYIRNSFYSTRFIEMIQRINEFAALPENLMQLSNVALAENCLAKFNNVFCRAKILKIFHSADGITAEVFYVDFGGFRVLPVEELIEIPDEFVADLPFQAIFCRLTAIRPIDSPQWCDDICDTIYDDLLVKQKHFYVRSIRLADPDIYAYGLKLRSYEVVLFDETGHVNINNWIVTNHYGESDPHTKHSADVIFDRNVLARANGESLDGFDYAQSSNGSLIDDDENSFDVQFDDDEIFNMLQANGIPFTKPSGPQPAKIEEVYENENTRTAVAVKPLAQLKSPPVKALSPFASGVIDGPFTELACHFLMPKIKWHQTESIVVVAVHAPDVNDYSLCVTARMLKICFTKDQKKYCALLNLFGCIEAKYTVHDIRGLNIVIRLVKTLNRLAWPRLVQARGKDNFIEYNFEADKNVESQFVETPSTAAFCQPNKSYSSSGEENEEEEEDEIDPDGEAFAKRLQSAK